MIAGTSTACLYPKPLEESLYDLAVNGVSCVDFCQYRFGAENRLCARCREPYEVL